MKIIWKDSVIRKTYKYRKHTIERCQGGWITSLPEDCNIYYSIDCAHNAIDKALGGKTRKDATKRHEKGIHIIGIREEMHTTN